MDYLIVYFLLSRFIYAHQYNHFADVKLIAFETFNAVDSRYKSLLSVVLV